MVAGTKRIAILGSGMAGLGAAQCFRSEGLSSTVYDKNPYPGGHTASHQVDGFIFDEGPHVSFTAHRADPAALRRERAGRLPDGHGVSQQLLAGALGPASGNHQPARPAAVTRCRHSPGLHRPPLRSRGAELCGLAERLVRGSVRKDLPHAVHPQVPHDARRKHEHGVGRTPALSGPARGGAARRRLARFPPRALRAGLSLPDPGRLRRVSPATAPGRATRAGAQGHPHRPPGADAPLRQWRRGRLRPPDLVAAAARADPDDRRRAARSGGGDREPRLQHGRAGEHRRGAAGCLARPAGPISTTTTSSSAG